MNLEINELRLALKVSEDALLAEQQQKVKDRKLYRTLESAASTIVRN